MSNYPPGVSGNEFEIAGPDHEWEEEFECTNDEFEYVMISPEAYKYASGLGLKMHRTNEIEFVKENIYKFLRGLNMHFNLASITTETNYAKCGYVGEVLKCSYRNEIWWDCPQCGKHYSHTDSEYYGNED